LAFDVEHSPGTVVQSIATPLGKLTLDPGVLKLKALIAGVPDPMPEYVNCALLLAVSKGFSVVGVPRTLMVWEIPFACTGWPFWTALKDVKATGFIALFSPLPLQAASKLPETRNTRANRLFIAQSPNFRHRSKSAERL
jgi:hypothetical protein